MPFDIDRFQNTRFQPRVKKVSVPELSSFFDKDEKPEFEVRNLTAQEFGAVMDEVNAAKADAVRKLVASVSGGDTDKILSGLKGYLEDRKEAVSDDIIKRMHTLRLGTISPKLSHEAVKRLAKHAEPFYRVSKAILDLTGLGPVEPGELKGSGKSPEPKPQSKRQPKETQQAE